MTYKVDKDILMLRGFWEIFFVMLFASFRFLLFCFVLIVVYVSR